MANPFPFVASQILTAAEMNGIGEAVAFTPSFTNFTLGNGTATASYVLVNKLCSLTLKVTLGSTSSVTGLILVALPFTAAKDLLFGDNASINDVGSASYVGFVYEASASALALSIMNVAATYPTRVSTSATIPMTWASTDSFSITHTYEVA
jgi:hypothetical protein